MDSKKKDHAVSAHRQDMVRILMHNPPLCTILYPVHLTWYGGSSYASLACGEIIPGRTLLRATRSEVRSCAKGMVIGQAPTYMQNAREQERQQRRIIWTPVAEHAHPKCCDDYGRRRRCRRFRSMHASPHLQATLARSTQSERAKSEQGAIRASGGVSAYYVGTSLIYSKCKMHVLLRSMCPSGYMIVLYVLNCTTDSSAIFAAAALLVV